MAEPHADETASFVTSRIRRVAERFRMTEGQIYTLAIGLVIAVVPAVFTLPTLGNAPEVAQAVSPGAVTPFPEVPSPIPPVTTTTLPASVPAPVAAPTPTAPRVVPRPSPAPTTPTPRSPLPSTVPVGEARRFAVFNQPEVPTAVATDRDGSILVGVSGGGVPPSVVRYSASGEMQWRARLDSARGQITGLALDSTGAIFAAIDVTGDVVRLGADGNRRETVAVIPDVPICGLITGGLCEPGLVDRSPHLTGIEIHPDGRILVTDGGQATVWSVDRSGAVSSLVSDDRWVSADGISGPAGVAVDGAGNLVVTVASSLIELGDGGVYLVNVSSGEVTRVAAIPASDAAAGVVLARTGEILVALSGANAVAVHDATGSEVARFPTSGDSVRRPTEMAYQGTELVVTSQPGDGVDAAVLIVETGLSGAPA